MKNRVVEGTVRLLDLLCIAAAAPAAHFLRNVLPVKVRGELAPISDYWPFLALTLLLWVTTTWFFQVYESFRTRTIWPELGRIARALGTVAVVHIAAIFFLHLHEEASRLFFVSYFVIAFAALAANRVILRGVAHTARRSGRNTRVFAVVGSGDLAQEVIHTVEGHPEWGMLFAGHVIEGEGSGIARPELVLGTIAQLGQILDDNVIDEMIFAVPRERLAHVEGAFRLCQEQGAHARVCLDLFDVPRRPRGARRDGRAAHAGLHQRAHRRGGPRLQAGLRRGLERRGRPPALPGLRRHGRGRPARVAGSGLLPPDPRGQERPPLRDAQVPQHARRRRGPPRVAARAERGLGPGLQDAERPARHPRRRVHPPDLARRAAPVPERPRRGDEHRRPPPAGARRGEAVPALAAAPPQREAGHHLHLAGERPVQRLLRPVDEARPRVHRHLVALAGTSASASAPSPPYCSPAARADPSGSFVPIRNGSRAASEHS